MKKLYEKKYSVSQIEALKKQHGAIFIYETEDEKWCILKTPTLEILDAVRTIAGGSSVKFDSAMVENCWIDGDAEIRTEDKYKLGLFEKLHLIIKKVDGELGEL